MVPGAPLARVAVSELPSCPAEADGESVVGENSGSKALVEDHPYLQFRWRLTAWLNCACGEAVALVGDAQFDSEQDEEGCEFAVCL
jgi:hypothetical protein